MKTLIVYTLLEREWCLVSKTFLNSFARLKSIGSFSHLIIIQGNTPCSLLSEIGTRAEIVEIEESSVSEARNKGISKAVLDKFDFIIFHDSNTEVSESYCRFISSKSDKNELLCGKLHWSTYQDTIIDYHEKIKAPNILVDTYVGLYRFNLALIGDLRFNSKFGGGLNTELKSGEDVLFLHQYFKKNKIDKVVSNKGAVVFHPPRRDELKRLEYAKGQGAIYRFLLDNRFDSKTIFLLVLFFGNAFWGIIKSRPFAWEVYRLRIDGFFGDYQKLFLKDLN